MDAKHFEFEGQTAGFLAIKPWIVRICVEENVDCRATFTDLRSDPWDALWRFRRETSSGHVQLSEMPPRTN